MTRRTGGVGCPEHGPGRWSATVVITRRELTARNVDRSTTTDRGRELQPPTLTSVSVSSVCLSVCLSVTCDVAYSVTPHA